MEHWLHYLEQHMNFFVQYRYCLIILVLLLSFLEVVIPVIPGNFVLVFCSSLGVAAGIVPVWFILGATIGTFLASLFCYLLGLHLGERIFAARRLAWLLDAKLFLRITNWFTRYGYGTLLVSRFLPFARPGIALTAGIVRYDKKKSLIALLVSILASSTFYVMVGYLLGKRWREFFAFWQRSYPVILAVLGGGLLFLVILRGCLWKRRAKEQDKKA